MAALARLSRAASARCPRHQRPQFDVTVPVEPQGIAEIREAALDGQQEVGEHLAPFRLRGFRQRVPIPLVLEFPPSSLGPDALNGSPGAQRSPCVEVDHRGR